MEKGLGRTRWLIPDMYWPEITTQGHYVSHEAICVLNTGDSDCKLDITLFFEDREPIKGIELVCKARRTAHFRMDRINPTVNLPAGIPYAALVECSVPVVVQYSRLDTTQDANAMITTIAYAQ